MPAPGLLPTNEPSGAGQPDCNSLANCDNLVGVAVSNDGDNIVVAVRRGTNESTDPGMLWYSQDAGQTFVESSLTMSPECDANSDACDWKSLAACGNTATFYAVQYVGNIMKSTDAGETWTKVDDALFPSNQYAEGISCSADGAKVVLGARGGGSTGAYMSTDSGASWFRAYLMPGAPPTVDTGNEYNDACVDDQADYTAVRAFLLELAPLANPQPLTPVLVLPSSPAPRARLRLSCRTLLPPL